MNGETLAVRKVILATGIGEPNRFAVQRLGRTNEEAVQSYEQFMASMDDQFPLAGLRRVAVIGSGDSAKTVIEALTGQGPSRSHWSVAEMDWIECIDWYGPTPVTCSQWEAANRSRYKGIGRNLPRQLRRDSDGDPIFTKGGRLNITGSSAQAVTSSMGEAMVDGIPYDRVIVATGFDTSVPLVKGESFTNDSIVRIGGMQVGRFFDVGGTPMYLAGPAARLQLTGEEQKAIEGSPAVPENTVAIWRYSRKTATLAKALY